ncbi:hypothetical protein [Pedobacter hiemivivus]|uniref:Uncharacterized protein n=1 Tax=Pedobacter hiemivivus TaxID=2530454 RepID=A0A4R0N6X7_9SPHI|nr:hypothetical protein [Pedobacter hiemivivus]TCC95023.1 hypothetical protein EZ444_16075 [Pedobacter hiemivivus]
MIINIDIEKEFEIACDLLYIRPEEVIRSFVENVSLANFCSSDHYLAEKNSELKKTDSINIPSPKRKSKGIRPETLTQLATTFILKFNATHNNRILPAKKTQQEYFLMFNALLDQLTGEPNFEARYYRLIIFFTQWHQAVLSNISEHDAIIKLKSKKEPQELNRQL